MRLPLISLSDDGYRRFVDVNGRIRIFHGSNFVNKNPPYFPSFSVPELLLMKSYGINMVRVGCQWIGHEPQRGVYNASYLDSLTQIVDQLAEFGIYTLLDNHQDVYNPKYCGEGMPDWACYSPNTPAYPEPLASPVPVNPDNGYPTYCPLPYWGDSYFTLEASVAFQSLYDNEDGLLSAFASHWAIVAETFRNNSNVIGYEILNEPWMGDFYKNPKLLEPGHADLVNLQNMNAVISNAIREKDTSHLIFFEPVTWDYWPVGFTEPPGGDQYSSTSVLSYHIYCLGIDVEHMQWKRWELCDGTEEGMFSLRSKDRQRLHVGSFLTEFGAVPGDDDVSLAIIDGYVTNADKYLESWAYWAGQSSLNDPLKMKVLSHTYARIISGIPHTMLFDNVTARFSFSFFPLSSLAAESTEIYLNKEMWYPAGYSVNVFPSGSMFWREVTPYTLEFSFNQTLPLPVQVEILIDAN